MYVVLSYEKANSRKMGAISNSKRRFKVKGKVKSAVKGGLMVDIGVEAFLPASQIDIVPPKNLTDFVGKEFEFKVVKVSKERQNVVLSRRELIEQERSERKAKLLSEIQVGDIEKVFVKNITDFGAFIDLNGLDGLLHITDMSWGRISPSIRNPPNWVKN
jgi:small subunit ribosomal protein S1